MKRYNLNGETYNILYFSDVFPTFEDFENTAKSYYPSYNINAISEQWFNILFDMLEGRPLRFYPLTNAKANLIIKWISFYDVYAIAKDYTDKNITEILKRADQQNRLIYTIGEDDSLTTREEFQALSEADKVKYLQGATELISESTNALIGAISLLDEHFKTLSANNPLHKLLTNYKLAVSFNMINQDTNTFTQPVTIANSSQILDDVNHNPTLNLNKRLKRYANKLTNLKVEQIDINQHITTNTNNIGDLTTLATDDKSNLVNAVNELVTTDLKTVKSSIVINDTTDLPDDGINPVLNQVSTNQTEITTNTNNIGDLTTLATSDKTNVVNAINEVKSSSGSVSSIVSDDSGDNPDSGINPKLNQITTNTTDIATNKINITTNTTNIQTNTTNINTIVVASNKVNLTYSKGTFNITVWSTIPLINSVSFTNEQAGSLLNEVLTYDTDNNIITFLKDCDLNLTFYITFSKNVSSTYQLQATINGVENADATNTINNPITSETYTFLFIRSMKANDTLQFYPIGPDFVNAVSSNGTYIATFFMVDSSTTVGGETSNLINDSSTNPTLGINPNLIQIQTNTTNIGDMTTLLTTDKSSLVNAINELKGDVDAYDGS